RSAVGETAPAIWVNRKAITAARRRAGRTRQKTARKLAISRGCRRPVNRYILSGPRREWHYISRQTLAGGLTNSYNPSTRHTVCCLAARPRPDFYQGAMMTHLSVRAVSK